MKPLKRSPFLQPLSREHHEGLLFCWKIREGIKLGRDPERMKRYATWFFENHLTPHFREEERQFFPMLGNDHNQVTRALQEHENLHRLFTGVSAGISLLQEMCDKLEEHIRFEERVLFNTIQEKAAGVGIRMPENAGGAKSSCEKWEDEFWINPRSSQK